MSQYIKIVFALISSVILITAFQNCGQTGSISQASTVSAKAASDDPLVVDVVEDMDNVEREEQENKDGKKDYDRSKREGGCSREELDEVLANYACGDKKVLICHVPPGNPANRHEICVGVAALRAHMDHGHSAAADQDHLGKCDKDDDEEEVLPVEDEG